MPAVALTVNPSQPIAGSNYHTITAALGAATSPTDIYTITVSPNLLNAVYPAEINVIGTATGYNVSIVGTDRTNVKFSAGVAIDVAAAWAPATTYTVALKNMTITGQAASGPKNTIIDIRNMKSLNFNLNIDNCTLDAEGSTTGSGRSILWGPENAGAFTQFRINNCEIKDQKGIWTCIDNAPNFGVPGSANDEMIFTNNYVHDVDGSCAFRGPSSATSNTSLTLSNNVFDYNYNAHASFWAAFEINNCRTVTINNNEVAEIPFRDFGNGHAFQVWNRLEEWTLNMKNNYVHDNSAGPYIAVDATTVNIFNPKNTNGYAGPLNNTGGTFVNNATAATGASQVSLGAVTFYTPSGSIDHNKFVNNRHFGCCMSAYPPIDGNGDFAESPVNGFNAQYNWWNSSTGPSGLSQGGVATGSGDSVNKMLNYIPWAGNAHFTYFVDGVYREAPNISGLMDNMLRRSYLAFEFQKQYQSCQDVVRQRKMRNLVNKKN